MNGRMIMILAMGLIFLIGVGVGAWLAIGAVYDCGRFPEIHKYKQAVKARKGRT